MSEVEVIAGNPTAEELALVITLLKAQHIDRATQTTMWGAPQLRPTTLPTSWRASGLPR